MQLSGPWRASVADDDLRRSALSPEFDDSSWSTITVPGHWRSHPNFASNDEPLLYRTNVGVLPAGAGRRQFVTCNGVLYQADLWFDGAYLGDVEGMFSPAAFDITDLARLGDEHVLAVEVSCGRHRAGTPRRAIVGAFHDPDMVDPDWNPGGIWRPIHIIETGPVRIDRLRLLCRDANEVRAHLRLTARLDCDDSRRVVVRTTVDGTFVHEAQQWLARGINEVRWNLDVDSPRLWWPWSLGEQPLTDVTVEVFVDDELSDSTTRRTGLREVALHDFVLSVNGERLFTKGACALPTRRALAEASVDDIEADVVRARDAGLDLLRVHTHVARNELYEAADRLGMLLWQDFPLHHRQARGIRKEAVRQATDMVDVLGHHPSIVLWCGHDEPMGALSTPRQLSPRRSVASLARQQVPSWNRSILDRWVKKAFDNADESRPAVGNTGLAPHLPQLDSTGSHLYFGWQEGDPRDLARFAATLPGMVRFVSEFGAPAVPHNAEFMRPQKWPSIDWEAVNRHDADAAEAVAIVAPPDRFATFDEWRMATQRHQAEVIRTTIETLRTLKYRPTGGFCLYQWNDAEPRLSASVLDHRGEAKLGLQALTDACRPVIVVAERFAPIVRPGAAIALDVHVVSDIRRTLDNATCTATLRWPGGSHEWTWRGDIAPDACVKVGTIQFLVADAPGDLWLDLTLEHGEQVASNRYESVIVR